MPLQTGPHLTCFLVICAALSGNCVAGQCSQGQDTPIAPSVEIKTSTPADLMPIGYNVTLTCVGQKSERYTGRYEYTLMTRMSWWHGDRLLKSCGGGNGEEMLSCEVDIVNGTSTDTGEYECTVWIYHSQCFFLVRNFTWLEPTLPWFLVQPRGTLNVTAGSNVTIICEARGVPEASITWHKEGGILGKANISTVGGQSSLTLSEVTAKDHGTYWCIAKNTMGSVRSNSSTLQVPYAPGFIIHPKSLVVGWNANLTLECVAKGFPEPTIAWRRNNSTLANATVVGVRSRSLLILSSATAAKDDGNYSCVASNDVGVAVSNAGAIHVKKIPASSGPGVPSDPPQPLSSNIIIWSVVGATCAVVTATLTALFIRVTIIRRKKKSLALQVQFPPAGQTDREATAHIQVADDNEENAGIGDEKLHEQKKQKKLGYSPLI